MKVNQNIGEGIGCLFASIAICLLLLTLWYINKH